jgi:hypothetical protein
MVGPLEQSLQEKLHGDRLRVMSDRESENNAARNRLRDYAVHLREPGQPQAFSPASKSDPTFKISDATSFPFPVSQLPTSPGTGHLSREGASEFYKHMGDAAKNPDPRSRDAATGKAAHAVANDYANLHGLKNPKEAASATVLHEARAQVTFAAREVGQKLGLGPAQSGVVAFSLERALEKEGFKVFVSHAIDKSADVFKASASSAATSTGMRHTAENALNKSMEWLASHGVTADKLKSVVGQHSGKLTAVYALSQNPEVVQRAGQVIAQSGKGLDVVMNLATDDKLRKAVGTMALSTGETLASINKGVGSVAILAGSAMRGDSMEETGRHAFRAAMAIAGGAAGGVAAGAVSAGFGSIAGGVAGAAAGSKAAEYLIDLYDKHANNGRAPDPIKVSQQDLQESRAVIGERTAEKVRDVAVDRSAGMEREFRMKAS